MVAATQEVTTIEGKLIIAVDSPIRDVAAKRPAVPPKTTTTAAVTKPASIPDPSVHKKKIHESRSSSGSSSAASSSKKSETSDYNTGRWSSLEHSIFLRELEKHGKNWKRISSLVQTRSRFKFEPTRKSTF